LRLSIHPAPPLTVGELRRLHPGLDRLTEQCPDIRSTLRSSGRRMTMLLPDEPHDCEATARVAAMLVAALIGRTFPCTATCEHRAAPPHASSGS
jgi:hypothetical protein